MRGERRGEAWSESGKETKIEMVWKFAFNYEIKEGRGEKGRRNWRGEEKEMFHVRRLGAKIGLFRRPLIANGLFLPLPLSTSSSSHLPLPLAFMQPFEVLFVKEKGKCGP